MATYAVGDVQGCHGQLVALLSEIGYRGDRDRLWLVGDLVNRGPRSAEVLRFAMREPATIVLGNHDLHLLAAAHGLRAGKPNDTFDDVLAAPDCDQLLDWLRRQPLLHEDVDLGVVMVHAGLAPAWTLATARRCARELEAVLAGDELGDYLAEMYGNEPRHWSEQLSGIDRLRFITNAFTRMRYCDQSGGLDLDDSAPPGQQRPGLVPWFEAPGRRNRDATIVFGHWATLRLDRRLARSHGVIHLDTGCVWGGQLTAIRIEDRTEFSVPGWEGLGAR